MKILKRFEQKLSRFLLNHPNFGLNRLMLYVVIGNLLVYLFMKMDTTGMLAWYLCFIPGEVLRGQIWRLVTFVFVPDSYRVLSLVLQLYFYYLIGSSLERVWGRGRFTAYYLSGMVLSILYGILASLITGSQVAVTGSYISLSMFFVFATLWPDNRVLLFFIIPIKIKWLAYLEAVMFLLNMIFGATLLPLVGIANYFLFCGDRLIPAAKLLWYRIRPQARQFRRTVKEAKKEEENRSYTRKCAVCGATDTEHPELEFRYCSKCVGYHCFCQEHITSHVHFTQP